MNRQPKAKVLDTSLVTLCIEPLEHPFQLATSSRLTRVPGSTVEIEEISRTCAPYKKQVSIRFVNVKMESVGGGATFSEIMEVAQISLGFQWHDLKWVSERQLRMVLEFFEYEVNVSRIIPLCCDESRRAVRSIKIPVRGIEGDPVIKLLTGESLIGNHNPFYLMLPFEQKK